MIYGCVKRIGENFMRDSTQGKGGTFVLMYCTDCI